MEFFFNIFCFLAQHWPPLLQEVLDEGDKVGLEAPVSFQLAVSALGGITW